ncbi:molecular chaperone Skp [Candidatus Erwinia haradaeae]|uniref:Chaperone protein Skp n=1 Tax=Candidatus Erwinia haradaeae TaxID=1922217 RepID=A0A803FT59_9GAMM|nr:molecular chaperone Skp [Candidatus Erwinia haradaeae]VFP87647.1 Chaperone protein Skp [Candidatus Erwinia haradaeae]
MKQFFYIAGFSLFLSTCAIAEASDKIAVVNMSSIFQQLPERAASAQKLENEFKERTTELQGMEHDLQTKIRRLQRDGFTMKPSERISMEQEVIQQRESFSNKVQVFDQDNRRRQIEERNKILERIQNAVKKIARSQGYDIVFDQNAIAYVAQSKDITDDVLKQVQ